MTLRVLNHRLLHCFILIVLTVCIIAACQPKAPEANTSDSQLPDLPALAAAHFNEFVAPVRQQFVQLQHDLQSSPQDPQVNLAYARLLHAYDLYRPAATVYARCQILRPNDLDSVYLHALVLHELGDAAAAVQKLESLLARKPDYPRVAVVLAQHYREQGLFAKAMPIYTDLLKHDSANSEARYGLALALIGAQEFARAKQHLHKLHEGTARYGAVHAALATVYRQEKNQDEVAFHTAAASQHSQTKISFDDASLRAVRELREGDQHYIEKARQHFTSGQYQAAAAQYQLALAVNPHNDNVHANLTGIYGELGNIDQAQQHFDQAVALNPRNVLAFMNLGVVLMKRSQFDEARGLFDQVLDRQPHHAQARVLRAYCGELLGDNAQIDEYRQALADDPGSQLANYLLAQQLHKGGKCQEAVPYYEKSLHPNNSASVKYHIDLARCYVEQQRFELARQTIGKGLVLAQKHRNIDVEKSLKLILDELPQS